MRQIGKTGTLRPAWLLGLTALLVLPTCATPESVSQVQTELDKFKQVANLRFAQQAGELSLLRDENKKIWHNLHCADQQVSDFMAEAEQCQGGQCPQKNLERVLGFMVSQKHVLVRLKPNQQVSDMAPSRVSQLRDLLEPRQLTGLSRILMLTMQTNLGREEPATLAERQADATLLYIRRTLQLAPTVPRVGPFSVTCQNKAQLLDGYARKFPADRVVPGEPKSKDAQVTIWIFKVDC